MRSLNVILILLVTSLYLHANENLIGPDIADPHSNGSDGAVYENIYTDENGNVIKKVVAVWRKFNHDASGSDVFKWKACIIDFVNGEQKRIECSPVEPIGGYPFVWDFGGAGKMEWEIVNNEDQWTFAGLPMTVVQ